MLLLSGGLLVRLVVYKIRLRASQKDALVELRALTKELNDQTSIETD